jgi:hypothetical protein
MPGHFKKMCSGKNNFSMKVKHSRPKFGNSVTEISNCDIVKMIKEFNKNNSTLGKKEEELKCSTYRLIKCMGHSKELIKVQQKLCQRLFTLTVTRTPHSVFSVDVSQNARNPRIQSLPLTTAVTAQVQRILSGHDRMEKLNNKIIDCLNHFWAIGDHNFA